MFVLAAAAIAQDRSRAALPEKYKWNLADLYPTEAAWRVEKDRLTGQLPSLRAFTGRLASSASVLADALDTVMALRKQLMRLHVYASMLSDEDTRDSTHQGMRQEMTQVEAALGAESAYIEPELLRAGPSVLSGFLAAEPRLGIYAHLLRDITRRAAHTLSDSEEKLLADVGPLAGAPSNVYGILSNADFPYPVVMLTDGRQLKVDQARYTELRQKEARE